MKSFVDIWVKVHKTSIVRTMFNIVNAGRIRMSNMTKESKTEQKTVSFKAIILQGIKNQQQQFSKVQWGPRPVILDQLAVYRIADVEYHQDPVQFISSSFLALPGFNLVIYLGVLVP